IRDDLVTGVQTCALPISSEPRTGEGPPGGRRRSPAPPPGGCRPRRRAVAVRAAGRLPSAPPGPSLRAVPVVIGERLTIQDVVAVGRKSVVVGRPMRHADS